jgi:hypothetical protein
MYPDKRIILITISIVFNLSVLGIILFEIKSYIQEVLIILLVHGKQLLNLTVRH